MPRSNWAREPQLLSLRVWSLCSATREATIVRGPRTTMKSGPCLPQLEKALAEKRRPNTAINKINKLIKKKSNGSFGRKGKTDPKIHMEFQGLSNSQNNFENKTKLECSHFPISELAIKLYRGTSLVAQWLRIHLPMQGTRVRSLVRDDPTCHRATKPVRHNY